ncbi:MBL fold metallo-hydrolase [Fredinandcohnia humi]
MIIKRLQWAGALIESENTRILIDPVYSSPNADFFGKPKQPFSPLSDIQHANAVLITHLHSDHFDPELIIKNLGKDILVLVPKGTEDIVKEKGLTHVIGMSVGDTYRLDNFTVIASHSVDGLGDDQVSWILKDHAKTVIHCGDTLWHGYWAKMAKQYGPFDAALLPINGAIVYEPGEIHSHQPICLTPEQAVAAAKVLEAELLIPIHYGSFHNPPIYYETDNLVERLQVAAERESVEVRLLEHLEMIGV